MAFKDFKMSENCLKFHLRDLFPWPSSTSLKSSSRGVDQVKTSFMQIIHADLVEEIEEEEAMDR